MALAVFEPMAAAPAAGVIVGVVTTTVAAPEPIRVTIDPEVCGQTLPDESIVRDAAGHVANVVVTLAGVKRPGPEKILVANERCRFTPRVSLLRPKGSIEMTSRDPVLHTMHAAPVNERVLFNVSLPVPNIKLSRPVDRPGVVLLTCSTHTWMRGSVHVIEEASAVSQLDGTFRIDDVPPGSHQLRIWHETLKAAPLSVTVKDGEITKIAITLTR